MTDLTLTCMRGYPGSGKSTRARELAKETGAVVVCRDDLRMMLHGTYWTGQQDPEHQVTIAEHAQVEAFLKAEVSVIVDATHLRATYLRRWVKTAVKHGATFHVEDVTTTADVCIIRDRFRPGRKVGQDVITQMAKKFPIEKWPTITAPPPFKPEPVQHIPGATYAVIIDIDGTLAHMTGRSPYDYSRVSEDAVDTRIAWLAGVLHELRYTDRANLGPDVIIMSGRPDTCRHDTVQWLRANGIAYDHLYMRPADAVDERGNQLPDWQVKYDLFNQHIRGHYNISFILDDRQQVVDLWRAMGLKCLQVAPGDF